MAADMAWAVINRVLKREASDADSDEPDSAQQEIFASWSLLILIILLIAALFVSYILQARRIQAVHETVISIFAGMFVGLALRLFTATQSVLGFVSFDYQFFFNLLLPPIILASGYELHQGNFFRHMGTILTFAFAGTFISALVLGIILYVWALSPIESMDLSFVEAISVGATLSATDPVTILAIFNTYKVDPKLYTVIFGESILNDAVAIVIFETAQRYKAREPLEGDTPVKSNLTIFSLFESFGVFLLVFFGSLVIGLAVGIGTSLLLKMTYIRRFPKIESCIILLIAYASYFFANAIHMSGIVSLLFCGICLKHYAYHNMSRRTQLTTKFIFQVLSQLSENFIFIYLGLSLFTEKGLDFKPLFILVTVFGICAARWLAVFPLSSAINWTIRYRAAKKGREATDELPFSHQAMLFWAGLRGAVGVALAVGLTGPNSLPLRATVLIVVVLTVIIFGGTTARMLEILGIRTGVVDELDSDDEFDIEVVGNGNHAKRGSTGFGGGVVPPSRPVANGIALQTNFRDTSAGYSTGNARGSPDGLGEPGIGARKSSRNNMRDSDLAAQALLSPSPTLDDDDAADLDLPPLARRAAGQGRPAAGGGGPEPTRATSAPAGVPVVGAGREEQRQASGGGAAAGLRQFLSTTVEDPATWFRQIDEEFIKPKLLLDPGDGNHGPGAV